MNFNEYQEKAMATATYPSLGRNLMYPVLGLMGEAGEVAEKIKKLSRNQNIELPSYFNTSDEFREALAKELGDVLWYIAALSTELRLKLDDVAAMNIAKLLDRQQRGVIKSEGDNR